MRKLQVEISLIEAKFTPQVHIQYDKETQVSGERRINDWIMSFGLMTGRMRLQRLSLSCQSRVLLKRKLMAFYFQIMRVLLLLPVFCANLFNL